MVERVDARLEALADGDDHVRGHPTTIFMPAGSPESVPVTHDGPRPISVQTTPCCRSRSKPIPAWPWSRTPRPDGRRTRTSSGVAAARLSNRRSWRKNPSGLSIRRFWREARCSPPDRLGQLRANALADLDHPLIDLTHPLSSGASEAGAKALSVPHRRQITKTHRIVNAGPGQITSSETDND